MALQYPGGGGIGTVTLDQELDPGIITGISAFVIGTGILLGETILVASISQGPPTLSSRYRHLADGNVASNFPFVWHGFIDINPGDHLVIWISGELTNPIKITEHRLTLTRLDAIKAYLRELPR
jgi:hypothetical protein